MKLCMRLPFVLIAILIMLTAASPSKASEQPESATLIVKTSLSNEPRFSVQSIGDVATSEVAGILREVQQTGVDTLVTTDHPQVMKLAADAYAQTTNKEKFKFMPLGALTKMSAAAKIEYRDYLARAHETLNSDKVTLLVLAITTATDSLVWIHATSLGFPQKLSMVSLNMLMAVTLGLDRELWGKLTTPIQTKMTAALGRLGAVSPMAKAGQILASQFAANLAMGTAFYVLRGGILSFDQIDTMLLSTTFWAHTLKLTTMMTLTQFAWAEVYKQVDERLYPIAKLNLKRIADMRGVILASLASMSMIFQPAVYGNTPIITFAVHGMLGLAALVSIDKLIHLLETSKASNLVYKYSTRFEDLLKMKSKVNLKCENLFAI